MVAILGDLAYESGTEQQFAECFGPSWGGLKDRTRPVPGNHDYRTAGAAPYFGYFNDLAGDPTRGYYSYDLGSWHIVALNSNCDAVGGCGAGSPQLAWLAEDLGPLERTVHARVLVPPALQLRRSRERPAHARGV